MADAPRLTPDPPALCACGHPHPCRLHAPDATERRIMRLWCVVPAGSRWPGARRLRDEPELLDHWEALYARELLVLRATPV